MSQQESLGVAVAQPAIDLQIDRLSTLAAPSIARRFLFAAQLFSWVLATGSVILVAILIVGSKKPIHSYAVTESGLVSPLQALPDDVVQGALKK